MDFVLDLLKDVAKIFFTTLAARAMQIALQAKRSTNETPPRAVGSIRVGLLNNHLAYHSKVVVQGVLAPWFLV